MFVGGVNQPNPLYVWLGCGVGFRMLTRFKQYPDNRNMLPCCHMQCSVNQVGGHMCRLFYSFPLVRVLNGCVGEGSCRLMHSISHGVSVHGIE